MKNFIFCLSIFAVFLTAGSKLDACTGIKLTAKDGSVVHGRTLEFGIQVDISMAVVPKGYAFKGTTPNGEGLSYVSKYGAVGAMAFGNPALMDGLNEKGLGVGTFYFPTCARYARLTPENQSQALSPVEFSNWLLTQFADLEEVKVALSNVVIVPTVANGWGDEPPPFHYIVFDKGGKGLVIEPIDGKLMTYETTLGTFTNSPTFDWHMTNLRNYIHLTPFNAKPVTLDGLTLKPFGEGSGMVGLPGDFTPPSRFVRAAIFSATALPSANAEESIFQVFHILNQFDIPVGIAKEKVGDVIYSDQTQLTCARDPHSLKYYFKTYKDQNIKMIHLNELDLSAKSIKKFSIRDDYSVLNITSRLKDSS